MTALPTARLGGVEISRLIIGGDPSSCGSYSSEARKGWAKAYLTDDRIVEMLETLFLCKKRPFHNSG